MKIAALIVAAGRGTRAGKGLPKQWRPIANAPVARHTVQALMANPNISQFIVVIHPDDQDHANATFKGLPFCVDLVHGGATRDSSVRAGLEWLAKAPPDMVLIHDVARPLVTACLIDHLIEALKHHKAAAPAMQVTDALWQGQDGRVTGMVSREGLYRAQTPQGFQFQDILAAHQSYKAQSDSQSDSQSAPQSAPLRTASDDVEVARLFGLEVVITLGDETNIKITSPEDFLRAESLLLQREKR